MIVGIRCWRWLTTMVVRTHRFARALIRAAAEGGGRFRCARFICLAMRSLGRCPHPSAASPPVRRGLVVWYLRRSQLASFSRNAFDRHELFLFTVGPSVPIQSLGGFPAKRKYRLHGRNGGCEVDFVGRRHRDFA